MVPENFQQAISDVKTSLAEKADKTEVETLSIKVANVDTKINDVRKTVGVIALDKGLKNGDKALVYVYASFVQEGNEAGFRRFLKSQGKEKKFEDIKKGYIKLTPQ